MSTGSASRCVSWSSADRWDFTGCPDYPARVTDGPLFFLSYSRNDRADRPADIKRLHDDVSALLRQRFGVPRDRSVGFLDDEGIEPGAAWPDVLREALRTARAFVPLLSPSYFASEYCGKEWASFTDRLPVVAQDVSKPGLVQPVLLVGPQDLNPMPPAVQNTQFTHADYPAEYAANGLAYLLGLPSQDDNYRRFVHAFADKLVRAIRNNELPPAEQIPPLDSICSAFHDTRTRQQLVSRMSQPGRMLFAQFVYVAARAEELTELRIECSAYGELGGLDWRPYLPSSDAEIHLLANKVALDERFRYESVDLNDDLIDRINAAENARKVVVLVVDTWTLRLPRYRRLMEELDRYTLPNCVVVVPINRNDVETARSEAELELVLTRAFMRHHVKPDPDTFATGIDTPEELMRRLARALGVAKMRIIKMAEMTRATPIRGSSRMPVISASVTGEPQA